LEVVNVELDKAMKDKDLEKRHPSMSFPYIETANGEIIFEDLAIAQHLARQNRPSGLYGNSMFQEA
jgi:glutathione S-transferase